MRNDQTESNRPGVPLMCIHRFDCVRVSAAGEVSVGSASSRPGEVEIKALILLNGLVCWQLCDYGMNVDCHGVSAGMGLFVGSERCRLGKQGSST